MTIEDKHTLLLRAIQCYVDTAACHSAGGDVDYKAVIASYAEVASAVQALMLEVAEAAVCAVAVGDQRSMAQLYDAAEPVMREILEEGAT